MTITLEGKVVGTSIDRHGNPYATIEIPDDRYQAMLAKQHVTIPVKFLNVTLGQKMEVSFTDLVPNGLKHDADDKPAGA